MLFLAKFAGIAVLVWFYLTAKDKGEQPFKWAIVGLIGYWIAWWAVKLTVVSRFDRTRCQKWYGHIYSYSDTRSLRSWCSFFNQKKNAGGYSLKNNQHT